MRGCWWCRHCDKWGLFLTFLSTERQPKKAQRPPDAYGYVSEDLEPSRVEDWIHDRQEIQGRGHESTKDPCFETVHDAPGTTAETLQ